MKKFKNPVYMAIIAGITFFYVISLFLLTMTYQKDVVRVAHKDYVREVTRWPGNKRGINIPAEYALLGHNNTSTPTTPIYSLSVAVS